MDTTASLPGPVLPSRPVADRSIGSIARQSLREHRLAVLAALLLFALCAGSALVITAHLIALDPLPDCWRAWYASGEADGGPRRCEPEVYAFYAAADPGRFLTEAVGMIATTIAGLLLVVPVTARAARRGTGTDGRTLAAQLLPMLLIGLAGFIVLGFLFGGLRGLIQEWAYQEWGGGRRMEVAELGYEGIPLVGRGVLVMGVGALAGALVRRPLVAGAVALALILGYTMLGTKVVASEVAMRVATPVADSAWGPWPWNVYYVGARYQLPDGRVVTPEEAVAHVIAQCPTCDPSMADQTMQRSMPRVTTVAQPETYSTFFAVDLAISLVVGGTCLLLTFPVVARRSRPRGERTAVSASAAPA